MKRPKGYRSITVKGRVWYWIARAYRHPNMMIVARATDTGERREVTWNELSMRVAECPEMVQREPDDRWDWDASGAYPIIIPRHVATWLGSNWVTIKP